MSDLKKSTQVIAFFSVLYREDQFSTDSILKIFKDEFKLEELATYPCSYYPMKTYYSKEMGQESLLKRIFVFSSQKSSRTKLIDLKLKADEVEKKYSHDKSRSINIDPGYTSLEQVILSTGKPYSHRIYLKEGVYAELTYEYKDSTFHPLPWTYPDYCHDEIINFFNYIRGLCLLE